MRRLIKTFIISVAFNFYFIGLISKSYSQDIKTLISEDFETISYFNSIGFTGDTTHFSFSDINGSRQLLLNAPEAGTSYLILKDTTFLGELAFELTFDFSGLSGSNNFSYYFGLNEKNPSTATEGYVIEAGESGSDDVIKLLRIDAGSRTLLAEDTVNVNEGGTFTLNIARNSADQIDVFVNRGQGQAESPTISLNDTLYQRPGYSAFEFNYTSTRVNNFALDNIEQTVLKPQILDRVVSNDRIQLELTEIIKTQSLTTQDFIIQPGAINPSSIIYDGNRLTLELDPVLTFGSYTLSIPSISSIHDLLSDSEFYSFDIQAEYEDGDIVINEFMHDPPSELVDYIELWNTSNKPLDLSNWSIRDSRTTAYTFPNQTTIQPNGFLVLTADSSALFDVFGSQPFLELSSFPALNNTSNDQVRLYKNNDELVDSIAYSTDWGGNDVALERRSVSIPSFYQENWGPSPAELGGSPGLANTIEPDTQSPELLNVEVLARDTLQLEFDERINDSYLSDLTNFELTSDNADTNPIISQILTSDNTLLKLILSTGLDENVMYQFTLAEGLVDVFGNTFDEIISQDIIYLVADIAQEGDLFISEFMYDPPTGFSEFIELFNASDKVLDLNGYTFNDNSGNRRELFDNQTILRPNDYITIAPNQDLTNIFPEADIRNIGSRFSSLNNSGDHIVIRNLEGDLLDSLVYTSAWDGSDVSLERKSFDVSAVHQENWGPSPSELKATPSALNEIPTDELKPVLLNVTVPHPDSLIFEFNEGVYISDNLQLELPNGISGDFINSNLFSSVHAFLFDNSINENEQFLGTITGFVDLFGNEADSLFTFQFEFIQTEEAVLGDIFITEFMYDPPTGYAEFIEIYNASDKVIDLQNWELADNTDSYKTITDDSYILKPQTYLVITANEELENFFPSLDALVIGSRFSSLNNSDDQIKIRNASGALLDSLNYNSSWGGEEVSLERRSLTVSTTFKENWGDSPSSSFATPGLQNQVSADNTAPRLLSTIVDSVNVQLIFDERLDSIFAINSTITITPNRSEIKREVRNSIIQLTFQEELNETQNLTINIGELRDVFGNESEMQVFEAQFVELVEPELGDVWITEFVYANSDQVPEFIEIYNNANYTISINELLISDFRDQVTIEVEEGFPYFIEPNQYVALTESESFAENRANVYVVKNLPSLNNSGFETISIKKDSLLLDSLRYEFPIWMNANTGQSFEKRQIEALSVDPTSWGLNPNDSHTAGFANDVEQTIPDNAILFSGWINSDTLLIQLQRFIQSSTSLSIELNGTALSDIIIRGNQIYVDTPEPNSTDAVELQVSIDENGQLLNFSSVPAITAENTNFAPLVITEILYNPINDEDAQQAEFIEIFNPNQLPVLLNDDILKVKSTTNSSISSFAINSNGVLKQIPALSYAIIQADTANSFDETRNANYFALEDSLVFQVDRTSLSLSSDNSSVVLQVGDVVLDSVAYQSSWNNQNLADTRGRSLERILIEGPSNDVTNWTSSAAILGATPREQNSTFVNPVQPSGNQLEIAPNPFSPDEDGFEDNTVITWDLDDTNYVLKAVIYDRYGRKIRTLVEGLPAGKTGSLVWDGKRDDGTSNRMGIYILLFEANDSVGGRNIQIKKEIVIARRL